MPVLHMETEAVQATQAKIRSQKEKFDTALASITNQMNQTIGSTWVGNSATEFLTQYDTLRGQLSQQLAELDLLAQSLQNEINQWQDMAARLG